MTTHSSPQTHRFESFDDSIDGLVAIHAAGEGVRLQCGLPTGRNPQALALVAAARAWLGRYFDVAHLGLDQQLQKASFHELAARTAPDLGFAHLERVYRWYLWLFLVDDVTDPAAHASGVDGLLELHAPLHEVLDGRAPGRASPIVAHILHDMLEDLARVGESSRIPKLIGDTRRYLHGNAWEAHYRQSGELPGTAVYAALRPDAGAAYTAFDLFPILDSRFRLSPLQEEHLCIRTMRRFANLHISWVNDIFGYARELLEENPSNLVTLIEAEGGVSAAQARRLAIERCNQTLRDYLDAKKAWQVTQPAAGPEAHAYVGMMDRWISGSLAWHRMSGRYRTQHALDAGQGR